MTEKNKEELVVDSVALRSLDRCIDCLNAGQFGTMWLFTVSLRKDKEEEKPQ